MTDRIHPERVEMMRRANRQMRRAIVLVMVEPPDNRGLLVEWQWPQARAMVVVHKGEENIIPESIANEARIAAQKCIALAGETDDDRP